MYKLKEIAWNDLLGNYYSLHDQHEKAVTYFQRALKLNPQYTSAWTLMGHEFMERKNTSAAIEAYRKAIGKLLCKDEVSFASCNINNEFFLGTFTCKKWYNPENTYCSRWLCCRLK